MSPFKTGRDREVQSSFRKAAPYLNIGYTLIGGVLFFGYFGNLLDKKTGNGPIFLLLGLFLGLGLGFYNMYKVIKNMEQR